MIDTLIKMLERPGAAWVAVGGDYSGVTVWNDEIGAASYLWSDRTEKAMASCAKAMGLQWDDRIPADAAAAYLRALMAMDKAFLLLPDRFDGVVGEDEALTGPIVKRLSGGGWVLLTDPDRDGPEAVYRGWAVFPA